MGTGVRLAEKVQARTAPSRKRQEDMPSVWIVAGNMRANAEKAQAHSMRREFPTCGKKRWTLTNRSGYENAKLPFGGRFPQISMQFRIGRPQAQLAPQPAQIKLIS
ncbi:hypothetical protein [Methylocapsa acidiphila]|uniref:hypothetical protein n=1 Tax=Methylocapsa acidiphila TaxID=133552 RepID=UPI000425FF89|nr:hypothetical protein [Methylocapsa acidiphila]